MLRYLCIGLFVLTAAAEPEKKPLIRVEALIDGRSQLILRGKTAQWRNLQYAAPGRHGENRYPTVINGKKWMPEWPDEKSDENRDCKCKSDVFEGVEPAVPDGKVKASVKIIQGRGKVKVVKGEKEDDGAMVVEFDDNSQGGHNPYVVEVSWEEVK